MLSIKNVLLVAAGGAIGASLRFVLSCLFSNTTFPYTTLAINILGSFCIAAVFAYCGKNEAAFYSTIKLFVATGICGGFTTFSTFSAENVELLKQQQYGLFFVYVLLSVMGGIGAFLLGYKLFAANV
jgi:fluoride exporter